jgi:2-iminobutanoate/2-iminopropanoate deaminase
MKEKVFCKKWGTVRPTHQHAIKANGFIYSTVCGYAPDGKTVSGGIEAQTKQLMNNMNDLLIGEGLTLEDVVDITVFIKDHNDFSKMNDVYYSYFPVTTPMRATVEVSWLADDLVVEMKMIAALKD